MSFWEGDICLRSPEQINGLLSVTRESCVWEVETRVPEAVLGQTS